jgi:hypothetical protein
MIKKFLEWVSTDWDFSFTVAGFQPASGEEAYGHSHYIDINPATGLMMMDGICSLDLGGSPWGQDIHNHLGGGGIGKDW